MNKYMHNLFVALLGIMAGIFVLAVPLTGNAYAAAQSAVTTKSYDMDEYLNMLANTGQWEKYDKFVKVASPESLAKHQEWFKTASNSVAEMTTREDLAVFVKSKAAKLGFNADKDDFTVMSIQDDKAVVRVIHEQDNYYVVVQKSSFGYWFVDYVYVIK